MKRDEFHQGARDQFVAGKSASFRPGFRKFARPIAYWTGKVAADGTGRSRGAAAGARVI